MCETLVISGGSVKGIGVLGALQYISESHSLAQVRRFYGTSCGAILVVLLALEFTPGELLSYFTRLRFDADPKITLDDMQLINYDSVLTTLEGLILERRKTIPTLGEIFKEKKKRIFIVTYNYTRSKMELLSYRTRPDMDCLTAIKLSCALPFIFKRVYHDGDLYLDGGFVCNFPLNVAFKHRSRGIIAINIRTGETPESREKLPNYLLNILFASMNHCTEETIRRYRSKCTFIDLVLFIPFTKFRLSPREIIDAFAEGYKMAQTQMS